ncbi:MAG: glutamine--fructose-6-phosphate transaminase (isomerizing) [Paludibacteraceae bacterium]|nr:glutamine--fructose-6-phosphate transaminase (isomerizing) [Paludibacteraceae bacterium]
MCGIVGYIGNREACPILIGGLRRLEYRGYDSAGIALLNHEGNLNVYKEIGKVANLEAHLADKDASGVIGIAHTRWATHGVPSVRNAHPHLSQSGRLALVHNGIIENYAPIKQHLSEQGYTFQSDTDTEVLVQLIEFCQQRDNLPLHEAVRRALNEVIGAYAIAVVDRQEPDMLVVARQSSPLVIGVGEDNSEFFVASDATPIIEYTNNMVYLNDGEVTCLRIGQEMQIHTLQNEHVDAQVQFVDMSIGSIEKGGFDHFMIKEIYEQPQSMRECMRGRLLASRHEVVLSAVNLHRAKFLQAKRIIIVSCGTSWHAGLIGKQLIESWCRIPVTVEYASEFRYSDAVVGPDDVVIAVSQSGETADTLAALQLARERGAFLMGIVNAVGSSIARTTDTGIYTHVGPEIGVASTKAFTGQVLVFAMFALALGREKGVIDTQTYEHVIDELSRIPDKMETVLRQNDYIADLSKRFTYAHNFIYLGRGYNYPVALEGALKLKEISYIHAEGYPAAEMKHGPIALIDGEMPVVCIATHHQLYEKILSNIQEVKSRGGRVFAVVTEGDESVCKLADYCIQVPETLSPLAPLLAVVPLQLLAYHVAVQKGLNVDRPRNLAKSVTVE